jgi:hypothetical protein
LNRDFQKGTCPLAPIIYVSFDVRLTKFRDCHELEENVRNGQVAFLDNRLDMALSELNKNITKLFSMFFIFAIDGFLDFGGQMLYLRNNCLTNSFEFRFLS